ncbi:MAG: class I SAM-dependent methyltransferase [Rhodobacteraceae bacterium]|nr:class I SAM-dependent methyltransferase [Paracoccaceae bacterium]
MALSRLSTAIGQQLFTMPEGPVAVLRPVFGYDLSALPVEGTTILHGFRPDYEAWQASGYKVGSVDDVTTAAVALVVLPRSKSLGRALVARAMQIAPFVLVDGQKTDGVDSLWREAKKRIGAPSYLSKAHGRLFWLNSSDDFDDWRSPEPAPGEDGFVRLPGVFADGGADAGSVLLAEALPKKLPGKLADLGAGWGYLSAAALTRTGVKSIDLIEAENIALACARANVTDERAQFHWADALSFQPAARYEGIICNPPFHTGRKADPGLGRAFIASAAKMMVASGQLWLVANRHLPYEATLGEHFRNVREFGGDNRYKLFHATRPLR